MEELEKLNSLLSELGKLGGSLAAERENLFRRLERLNEVGAALSIERNTDRLLEKILEAAKGITHADAGTLYRISEDGATLNFEIVRNDRLGVAYGGASGEPIDTSRFRPLPLRDERGAPNNSMVAAYSAIHRQTLSFTDAYEAAGFDFSGTKRFDAGTGYRSKSFLTVPMINHENEVIGVLQLINRMDQDRPASLPFEERIVPFSDSDRRLAESLASQAAIALTNAQLIRQLQELFESFVKLLNEAIDEKSPYTGGHCKRVPELTMLLAEAANQVKTGPLAGFTMSDQDRDELRIAGLLHDCGKVTTPVHVVDKATKLQTIWDRVELIDTRIEVLKRDAEIAALRRKLELREPSDEQADEAIEADCRRLIGQLDDDREFLRRANMGSEKMIDADRARVRDIARRYSWRTADGRMAPLLMCYRQELEGQTRAQPLYDDEEIARFRAEVQAARDHIVRNPLQTRPVDLKIDLYDEVENLTIPYGTLTAWERHVINYHISATIKMLEALPWPKHLKNVPEYASGHHERMDGKGYPKGLAREQMSVQARVMGIADIFEALTARDRPYKVGKTLSESLHILGKFRENGHIDPDLFDVFVSEKVYQKYANASMDPAQIDEVDESRIPGYRRNSATS